MHKIILQARFQQYMNQGLLNVQAGFRKGKGTRDQITSIHWITDKAREFQKNIYLCFTDYTKVNQVFGCVDHNKLENSKEMGILDHLTCPLRNLYAGQEATVRTGQGYRLVPNREEYVKVVYCHPAYLSYVQSTS